MNLMNLDKTVPYIRKKGIAGYFQLIFHNFFDFILLNLVFTLTCLPIFTFGASYKALIEVCNKYAEDKVVYPIREYFANFKKEFGKSTLYGLFFIAAFAVIDFSCWFYFNMAKQTAVMFVLAVICAVCHILLTMIMGWFFPIFTKIDQKFTALVTNSLIFAFGNIKSTLCYLLSIGVCAALVFALFPYSVPFIAVLPFFIIALASSCGTAEKINEAFGIKSDSDSDITDNDDNIGETEE